MTAWEKVRAWKFDDVAFYLMLGAALAVITLWTLAALATSAGAQHNHELGHDSYKSWANQREQLCCDNSDCGHLKDDEERTRNGKLEIKVEGEWCPVEPWHYLKRGNVANAAFSHACVWPRNQTEVPVCSRLRCYQPRPLS